MKKQLSVLLFLLLAAGYGYSQTVVKMVLPQNCADNTTAVEKWEKDKNSNLEIYPTPSNGNFTLYIHSTENIMETTVQIYNALGAIVYSEQLFCDSPNLVKQYALTNLLPGQYIVKVKSEKRELTQKLLIK